MIVLYIIMFLFGTFVGVPIVSGFMGLVKFIVERRFGREVIFFRYMWFYYQKGESRRSVGFSPICELRMQKQDETDKEVMTEYAIETAVNMIVCVICDAVFVGMYIGGNGMKWLNAFLIGIGAWYTFFVLLNVITTVIAIMGVSRSLTKYCCDITVKLQQGIPLDIIDIPDYKTLGCRCSDPEVIQYQCYAFMKKVWDGKKDELGDIVRSLETALDVDYTDKSKEYLAAYTPAYYDLIFYYSTVKFNPMRADYFYNIVEKQLLGDRDANGRRVLAYYSYYARLDIDLAEQYINEALELLPEFSHSITERYYEEMLINRLKAVIDEKRRKYKDDTRAVYL